MHEIISHALAAYDLRLWVTNYGASLQDLRLEGYDMPLVLGFPDAQDYASHHSHMGATAGRYANRIANGQFMIDGHSFALDRNEQGRHTLHGGSKGCGVQLWQLEEATNASALFCLEETDGHMGFPGAVTLRTRYEIIEAGTLAITYWATTTKPTFVNLAHHSYFRLDDSDDIGAHQLQIEADDYLNVDGDNLPTGTVMPVTGTAFDFTSMTAIGDRLYDHNFCLRDPHKGLRPVAHLYSPISGISLAIESDQPGLQFYTSHHLSETGQTHHARTYHGRDGICLEPQIWPDSPNREHFPSALLLPNETYHQQLILRFYASGTPA